MSLRARVHRSFAEVPAAAWDACLPGEAEGWTYYRACESCTSEDEHPRAITVSSQDRIIAVAPLFALEYRLDAPLQGRLRRLTTWLDRSLRGILTLRVLGLGSHYAERCHLGFAPELDRAQRAQALTCMLDALRTLAAARGIGLTAVKDLSAADDREFDAVFARASYARMASLPLAVLDLEGGEEDYFARLSRASRKELRRKLKKMPAVSVESVADPGPRAFEIERLYRSTREHSDLDYGEFELLPPGYFAAMAALGPERVQFKLYGRGDRLIAFNLLFIQNDRIIDKFLGIDYAAARGMDIYAFSWMQNVGEALRRGVRYLQTGQTAYRRKLQLGSKLVPCVIRFRHRSRLVQCMLRILTRWIAFDALDPDLRAYRGKAVWLEA